MMDVLVGYDNAITAAFNFRGQPVVPVIGSVYYSLFDHAGVVISGHNNVAVTTNSATTQVSIALPQAVLTIANPKKFETRQLLVRYTYNGFAFQISKTIRVVPRLLHSVSPEMIRSYMGVNTRDLPDEDIDIFAGYIAVESDVTSSILSAALASGTELQLKADEAIMLRVVLNLIPSLQQRVAQTETNGIVGFSRPKIVDFKGLAAQASQRYGELINSVAGRTETAPTLAVMTLPTDPITGV